jgi:hypothetical protein
MVRLPEGIDIAGADVADESPPLAGTTILFELLCVVAANMKAA